MNAITDYKKRFFNLLESEMGDVKPLITEAVETVIPITFFLPQKKDATGNMVWDKTGGIKFNAPNTKGTQETSLQNYESILGLDFSTGGGGFAQVTSKKDAAGNIIGVFSLPNDKKFFDYLAKLNGQTISGTQKKLLITMKLVGGSKNVFNGQPTFKTYDTQQKTATPAQQPAAKPTTQQPAAKPTTQQPAQ
jgi:hypothetical protein